MSESSEVFDENDILSALLDLGEDEILTHWIVVFETKKADGEDTSGWLCDDTITPWAADGLLDWVKLVMKRQNLK